MNSDPIYLLLLFLFTYLLTYLFIYWASVVQ